MWHPVWWVDPEEAASLIGKYQGRTWPTPVIVADWLARAEEKRWDVRRWTLTRAERRGL